MQEGTVFDISHYMLEDGPGIRTNVFFKGCPLRCKWCSNVYGLCKNIELSFDKEKCFGCMACIKACPKDAVEFDDESKKSLTDFEKCHEINLSLEDEAECKGCNFECVKACPNGARKKIGFKISSDKVFKEIEKDRAFYRRSEGGVTLSGGEILMQPGFAKEVLKKCNLNGINTAIETSGFGKWEDLSEIINYCDTVFMDLKCFDIKKHKELTGVSNEIILENIKKASEKCRKKKIRFVVRIPLIPGLNDDEENLKQTAGFVKALSDSENPVLLNILPYHNFGEGKYELIGKDYELKEIKPPSKEDLERVKDILKTTKVDFSIGGYDI